MHAVIDGSFAELWSFSCAMSPGYHIGGWAQTGFDICALGLSSVTKQLTKPAVSQGK